MEVQREAIHICGYWTDAIVPEPVHIVIRAATLATSCASDIGFTRLPDGTYVHVNDMDPDAPPFRWLSEGYTSFAAAK